MSAEEDPRRTALNVLAHLQATITGLGVTVGAASGRPPASPNDSPHIDPPPIPPPSSKRRCRHPRGRIAGVSKIDQALGEVIARLRSGDSILIVDIAKAVGCLRQNLSRSKRFKKTYNAIVVAERSSRKHLNTSEDPEVDF